MLAGDELADQPRHPAADLVADAANNLDPLTRGSSTTQSS